MLPSIEMNSCCEGMAVAIAVLSRTKNDNEPKGVDCHRRSIAISWTHTAPAATRAPQVKLVKSEMPHSASVKCRDGARYSGTFPGIFEFCSFRDRRRPAATWFSRRGCRASLSMSASALRTSNAIRRCSDRLGSSVPIALCQWPHLRPSRAAGRNAPLHLHVNLREEAVGTQAPLRPTTTLPKRAPVAE